MMPQSPTQADVLTPGDAERMLHGTLVRLLPFPRADGAGAMAFVLWQLMQEEGVLLDYFNTSNRLIRQWVSAMV